MNVFKNNTDYAVADTRLGDTLASLAPRNPYFVYRGAEFEA